MPRRSVLPASALAAALALAGCSDGVRDSAEAVAAAPGTLLVGKADQAAPAAAKDARLAKTARDVADFAANQVDAAVGTVLAARPDHPRRLDLQRARLALATRAWALATAEQGELALLSVTAYTRISRQAMEQRLGGDPAAAPLLAAATRIETGAWSLAAAQLAPAQMDGLARAVERWREANPDPQAVFSLELGDLAEGTGTGPTRSGGLLGLLTLDPFSGLDPATRAVQDSRRSVERIAYRGERMAAVLRWQTQLMLEEGLEAPRMRRLLDGMESVAQAGSTMAASAATVAATAAALPDRVAAERQAVVQTLEANQGPLRDLLAETRGSLTAGREMAEAADRLVGSFDRLMARFQPPATAAASAPGRPFDITEYQRTAEAIGSAAERLDRLLATAGTVAASPEPDRRLAEVEARWTRLLWRTGAVAAGLILLAGAVLALVLRRRA